MVILMCISLYTSRVILDKLGVVDYGIYNVVAGVIIIFTFINGAMSAATQRFLNFSMGKEDPEETRRVFNASQIIHICIAVIVIILAETIGLWFLYNKMQIPTTRLDAAFWVFQFSTFSSCFLILSYPYNADIIARERMGVFAYISLLDGGFKLLIAFLVGISPIDKLIFYALLMMIAQITISLIYRIYCIRNFEETKFKIKDITWDLYKRILSFSGWNLIGNLANACLTQGTNILLNMFFGPAVNAAKGIAVQVENAVISFCNNFQVAMNPQIVKSYASNEIDYMHSLIFRASRFSFYLALIFSLPIVMKADFILGLWLKETPDYAVVFVQYTMFFGLVQSLANPLLTGSLATGNARTIMSIIATFFIMIIPICYTVLKLGAPPVAVFQIQLLMYVLAHVLRVIIVKKQLGFSVYDYIRDVLIKVLSVSILSFAIAEIINHFIPDSMVYNIIYLALIITVNVSIIWTIGITAQERKYVVNIIKKKISKSN